VVGAGEVGAMVTHQINHDKLTDSIAAPIHFVLAVIVALSTWPAHWQDPLTMSEPRPGTVHQVTASIQRVE
jgi:hypothetical protein